MTENRVRQDSPVMVRLTHDERESLNRKSQLLGVSLNTYCRHLLGLPADLSAGQPRKGNPNFVRVRKGKRGRR